MCKDSHTREDRDYAAYLFQVRSCTLEAALDELFPRTDLSASGKPDSRVESSECFVFYQKNERWAWRREDRDAGIIEVSGESFKTYLHCIVDARQHGWNGKPLCLFAARDFFRDYPSSR